MNCIQVCYKCSETRGYMFVQEASNKTVDADRMAESHWMLPGDFGVDVRGNTVIQHEIQRVDERVLPTFNHYKGADGGYVAIYTHNAERGVYGVGGDIYVIGQVRIQGEYVGRIFIPVGYKPGDNITQDPAILAICEEYFPDMKGEMWVGGDTGGWRGVEAHTDNSPNPIRENIDILDNSFDDWGRKRRYDDEGWPIHRFWW